MSAGAGTAPSRRALLLLALGAALSLAAAPVRAENDDWRHKRERDARDHRRHERPREWREDDERRYVYAPPPAVYAPPPVVYAPPAVAPPGLSFMFNFR